MNKTYHPKYGVRYTSDYVKITVDKPGLDGAVESVPVSTENDKPLCKEVVRTLHLPVKTKEGLTDYISIDKNFLVELLAYARSIEEKEPVYTDPDMTEEDVMKLRNTLRSITVNLQDSLNTQPKPWESL